MDIPTSIKLAFSVLVGLFLYGVFYYSIRELVVKYLINPAKKVSFGKRFGNFCFGLLLISIGSIYFLDPVSYTGRAQYDLRGCLKWVAGMAGIFPGICLIYLAFKKGNYKIYTCSKCEYAEKLPVGKNYNCPLCGSILIESK